MGKRKLVPLMPILVRLGACAGGLEWVRRANCATFREAWRRCPHVGYLAWLAAEAMWRVNDDRHAACERRFDWEEPTASSYFCGAEGRCAHAARRALEAIVSPAEVERALYDYAVREGLAS